MGRTSLARWVLLLALAGCGDDDDSTGMGEPGGSAGSSGASGQAGAGGAAGGAGGAGGGGCVAPECVARIGSGSVLAVAIDTQDRPVVVYTGDDPETGTEFLSSFWVRRLEGGEWVALGAPHKTGTFGVYHQPRLAIDASGHPVVAYGTSQQTTVVERYDGGAWLPVGEAVAMPWVGGLMATPTGLVVLGGNLTATFGFTYDDAAASGWAALPGQVDQQLLGATLDGATPIVATSSIDSGQVLVSRHDGAAWQAVAESFTMADGLRVTDVNKPGNRPPLLMTDTSSGNQVTGSAFVHQVAAKWSLPDPIEPEGDTMVHSSARVASSGDKLVVAYTRSGGSITVNPTLIVRQLGLDGFATLDSYQSETTALAGAPVVAVRGKQVALGWHSPSGSPGFYIGYRAVTLP